MKGNHMTIEKLVAAIRENIKAYYVASELPPDMLSQQELSEEIAMMLKRVNERSAGVAESAADALDEALKKLD